jgi:hypothetical protein
VTKCRAPPDACFHGLGVARGTPLGPPIMCLPVNVPTQRNAGRWVQGGHRGRFWSCRKTRQQGLAGRERRRPTRTVQDDQGPASACVLRVWPSQHSRHRRSRRGDLVLQTDGEGFSTPWVTDHRPASSVCSLHAAEEPTSLTAACSSAATPSRKAGREAMTARAPGGEVMEVKAPGRDARQIPRT